MRMYIPSRCHIQIRSQLCRQCMHRIKVAPWSGLDSYEETPGLASRQATCYPRICAMQRKARPYAKARSLPGDVPYVAETKLRNKRQRSPRAPTKTQSDEVSNVAETKLRNKGSQRKQTAKRWRSREKHKMC